MEKDQTPCVWLDMRPIGEETLRKHFPHILERCQQEGYDPLSQRVPIVPAQHYFMGGIWVDRNSRTSMNRLYAAGETSCNGVHGANRLASNSLLESLVFPKRAAMHMTVQEQNTPENAPFGKPVWNPEEYQDVRNLEETYKTLVLREIEKASGGSLMAIRPTLIRKGRKRFMNSITMTLNADHLLIQALQEDITSEDITTNSVMPAPRQGEVELICKQDGVIAGLAVFERVFQLLDDTVEVEFFAGGDR